MPTHSHPELLTNNTILIISPQAWGVMFVSKHNYAIALAKRGNRVFFLNPITEQLNPFLPLNERVRIERVEVDAETAIEVVHFAINFPYRVKFHARSVYDALMKRAVQQHLLRALPPLDVVWDFDCNLLYRDLAWFRAPLKIYQPVDQVSGENPTTKNADAIFSISAVILDIFRTNTANSVPLHLLHHGLGVVFADVARRKAATEILYQPATPLRFCYVGNLLLKFIDADAIEAVVTAMPTVEFHFIGPHSGANNNVAAFTDGNDRMQAFVAFLKAQPNVVLHGAKKQTEMIDIMEQQDGFFLCYDNTRDPNKGSNSHKLMEYLSFGKVVVSTFVSSYRGSDVLTMLPEATSTNPDNRQAYLALFEDVVTNITTYNHPDTQKARIAFALHNTYAGQVEVVSEKIKALG